MPGTIAKMIGGKPYQFPRLTPHDIIAVEAGYLEERRQSLIADLDAARVEPSVRWEALQAFRKAEAERDDNPITTYCKTDRGAMAIIEQSMLRIQGDKPNSSDIEAFDGEELLIIFAARLAGLISDEAAKMASQDDDPVPTKGGPSSGPAANG